ncbi:MAG: ZIP family metal transporter [Longimicrobiales bacterium]
MTGVLYAALAALGDVGGGLLVIWRTGRDRALLAVLTGFGAGFMIALVVLGMLPHAVEIRGGFIAVLLGYLVVHLTQHSLTPHFHFGEETHAEEMVSRGIGVWALVGLLPHSFFDGVAISSGFLVNSQLGVLVFTGIILHKVPTGVSLGSIMLASGNSRTKSIAAVLAIAAATIAGAFVTPFVGAMAEYGLPLAAGVTLYVAASNLIPESQHAHGWGVHGGFIAGVLAYFLILALLPSVPH